VNFRREARRDSSALDGKTRGAVHAGTQGEGKTSPGRPRSLVTQAGRQLRARTRARGAARAAAVLDRGLVILIGSL